MYDANWKSVTSNKVTVTINDKQPGNNVWTATVSYKTGDMLSFSGINYKCLQGHTSLAGWEPNTTAALWQKL